MNHVSPQKGFGDLGILDKSFTDKNQPELYSFFILIKSSLN